MKHIIILLIYKYKFVIYLDLTFFLCLSSTSDNLFSQGRAVFVIGIVLLLLFTEE